MPRFLSVLFYLSLASCQLTLSSKLIPAELRSEYRINPLGIDTPQPVFSWIIQSDVRNEAQQAYQVLVASDADLLSVDKADCWDSGKTTASGSLEVAYEGQPLKSRQKYYWKARLWNRKGKVSEWSAPATFEMGLLEKADWQAKWINDGKLLPDHEEELYEDHPAPLFRKTFAMTKEVKRARLYISGIGYYLAYLNGKRIGDHELDPAWTSYAKRILYSAYDVTELLEKGDNCLGVSLGNGWYNALPLRMWGRLNLRDALLSGEPQFISQLYVEYEDGEEEIILSDEQWKVGEGPLLRNSIYLGEVYDARREVPGWNTVGFDEENWPSAALAPDLSGKLQAQAQPPIRITAGIQPIKITEPKTGVYIFDMGENFGGWIQLKIRASRDTRLNFRYGELLYEDGSLNPMTSVSGQIKGKRKNEAGELVNTGGPGSPEIAWQADTYICKGEGEEIYRPQFTFHAFRYVEITGLTSPPELEMIEGFRMNSDVETVGSFECSDSLYNQIQEMCNRTFLSNIFGVQSDCPHRERFGYGGDIAATSEAFIFNYDMASFYQKTVRDWQDASLPDGMFTDTAPFVGIQYCGLGWAMAHPLLQLQLYRYYGNKRLLEEQYPAARKWFELVVAANPTYIVSAGLHDHESLTEAPPEVMITPLYYQTAKIMEEIAAILNLEADRERYRQLAESIRAAYTEQFLDKNSGKVGPGTQGSQSFALYSGIISPDQQKNVLAFLVRDIQEKQNNHLSTGILGTKFMLDLLSRYGYHELALEITRQPDFPGWGYMLENGATTLWEHWAFSDNTYSHNHPMFGSISQWFYNHLGGIQVGPESVGFNQIIIRPQTKGHLSWVKCHYQSSSGMIVSNWQKKEQQISMQVEIPANTQALIYLPAEDLQQVEEGGQPITKGKDLKYLDQEGDFLKFQLGPGKYAFEIRE